MKLKQNFRRALLTVLAAALLIPFPVQSDEPYAAEKNVKADAAAVEAKPAAKPADKAEVSKAPEAEKNQAIKKALSAIEIEGFAAPLVEALQQKLDLNADDAKLKQWIPQFTEQYRPILLRELNFIRQTCDLTVAQRPKVKAAGEAALKKAVRRTAEVQVNQMAGRSSQQVDPSKVIRDDLMRALATTLTPEAMEKFTDAVDKRTALRKRAAILCAVARMDSVLCLTNEQRDKITSSITAAWQDRWEQWLMLNIYGEQYFPTVPDAQVVPHLNADQKTVWSGLQKVDFGFWNGGGQAEANDGWWGDEPAKVVKPAGGVGFF